MLDPEAKEAMVLCGLMRPEGGTLVTERHAVATVPEPEFGDVDRPGRDSQAASDVAFRR